VPQSAQSANAVQPRVRPADAIQGQRSHGARALSILGATAGSNASPPAPEHQAVSPRNSTPSAQLSDSTGSTSRSQSAHPASAAVAKVDSVAGPNAKQSRRGSKAEAIRYRVGHWLGTAASAAAHRGDGGTGFWAMLGLMTLSALAAGGVGWALLTRMPSLRGAARLRIGPW
jgi:hypothetical protein